MYLDKIVIVVITNSLEINCKTLILKTKYKGVSMFRSKRVVIGWAGLIFWDLVSGLFLQYQSQIWPVF